jgi:hypothetical protein
MTSNSSLSSAKQAKKDEFYTQLSDIETELRHYKNHFKGKTVLCNCDDPYESNFFKYFAMNFNHFGLKKLVATSYLGSPVAGSQVPLFELAGHPASRKEKRGSSKAFKVEITHVPDMNDDGAIDLMDVEQLLRNDANTLTPLEGDGDFRSEEAVALLRESDVVVTNPPFSLFREYVSLLLEHNKQFIIIGSMNALTYKQVFPHIMEGRFWLGHGFSSGTAYFFTPNPSEYGSNVYDPETGLVKFGNVTWFTNLDISKRKEELILYKTYNPKDYPHYDNYDAIEVSRTADIPRDYAGIMGVPITLLERHNPEQFEIVGVTQSWFDARSKVYPRQVQVNPGGVESQVTKLNDGAAIKITEPSAKTFYRVGDEMFRKVYARILVRNLKPESS